MSFADLKKKSRLGSLTEKLVKEVEKGTGSKTVDVSTEAGSNSGYGVHEPEQTFADNATPDESKARSKNYAL